MIKKKKFLSLMSGTFMLMTVYLCGWDISLDEAFVELPSCPSCYGQGLCPLILPHQNASVQRIELTGTSGWKLMKFVNYKNVYYGHSGENPVVLKKLAHDTELREFDKKVCNMKRALNCNVSEILGDLLWRNNYDVALVIRQHPSVFGKSDSIMCNHSRILQHLYRKYTKIDKGPHQQQHFLTTLAINSEPLLLSAFEQTGWFPALRGTCGRVIVEDYVGPTLSQLSHVPWLERADYARQLLEMAQEFSYSEFRLYLTDVSLDNFAVDAEGKVKIIDAENIVMVDPSVLNLETTEHVNEGIGCTDCLSFSYEDLCGHTSADHNFFAVCKGMLSSTSYSRDLPVGLLYSPPSWVTEKYPALQRDIEDCAGHFSRSSHHIPRRRDAAIRLLFHIQDILRKSVKYS